MNETGLTYQTTAGALRTLVSDEPSAREYLAAGLLAQVAVQLQAARVRAGLSQEDLARLLETTQSAISRTEKDDNASLSMRRFVRWALACGCIPRTLELGEVSSFVDLAHQSIDCNGAVPCLPEPAAAVRVRR